MLIFSASYTTPLQLGQQASVKDNHFQKVPFVIKQYEQKLYMTTAVYKESVKFDDKV